jgi:formate hydrogenlyase subunit 6/NADH:ubiquinone oxidoreductase subunit I
MNDNQHDNGSPAQAARKQMVPVYVMGKQYQVPEGLTIMKAMEYAGYKFVRGCGCRGGICGACATVYRKAGDYHIRVGLACQTVVEPDMYLTQIPFYPANRACYDFAGLAGAPEDVFKLYPELFRCLACNSCTKACPMDVQVMDVISALKRGDIEAAARMSFDCIQCGLCASRCLGELPQHHMAQLARRLYGGKLAPKAKHLAEAVAAAGRYDSLLDELAAMDEAQLRKAYQEREMEPDMADEGWKPGKDKYLR